MIRQVNIHGPNDVRLDEVPEPAIGARDVLVKIKACGVCGTDLHYISQGGVGAGIMPLGHEATGAVMVTGRDVRDIERGQRVVINPMAIDKVLGNGATEGAFTDLLLVRNTAGRSGLLIIPDTMDDEIAALAEPLAVALHAVNRANPKPGQTAVVYGAGPIGLGIVFWLRRRGVAQIVSIDLSAGRLQRALMLGASATIEAGDPGEQIAARIAELHGSGMVFGNPVVGTDLYFDAAGASTIASDVITMAKRHATFVVVAMYSQPATVDMLRFLGKEMKMTSAVGYPDEFPEVISALMESGEQARKIISHRFAFSEVLVGLSCAQKRDSGKVMIMFT